MRITILGSGTSAGVPNVAFGWGECNSYEIKNRRLRSSILIEIDKEVILIDTTPDLREQLLSARRSDITSVLFTHAHADHCHGIDDLRPLVQKRNKALDMYCTLETFQELEKKFSYIFSTQSNTIKNLYPPLLSPNLIDYGTFQIKNAKPPIEILAIKQNHGFCNSTGFRIQDFAYSTDVLELDEVALSQLQNLKLWIVDALQLKPHYTHTYFKKTLSWIKELKVERAILTHLSTDMDFENISSLCPENVEVGYDGLVIEI